MAKGSICCQFGLWSKGMESFPTHSYNYLWSSLDIGRQLSIQKLFFSPSYPFHKQVTKSIPASFAIEGEFEGDFFGAYLIPIYAMKRPRESSIKNTSLEGKISDAVQNGKEIEKFFVKRFVCTART